MNRRYQEASNSLRDDQIAFLVIPTITEPDAERWRIALLEQLPQFWLIILSEELDWTEISAEEAQVPLFAVKKSKRYSGIVLHNDIAVIENEIADFRET